jgi:hypothetical protein
MLSIYFPARDLSACPTKERCFCKRLGGWKAVAPRDESVSEAGKIDNRNNSSLKRGAWNDSQANKYGKSYKCSGKPRTTETNAEKSEGLPRPQVKTFSLRKGRCDEGAVLGVP